MHTNPHIHTYIHTYINTYIITYIHRCREAVARHEVDIQRSRDESTKLKDEMRSEVKREREDAHHRLEERSEAVKSLAREVEQVRPNLSLI